MNLDVEGEVELVDLLDAEKLLWRQEVLENLTRGRKRVKRGRV